MIDVEARCLSALFSEALPKPVIFNEETLKQIMDAALGVPLPPIPTMKREDAQYILNVGAAHDYLIGQTMRLNFPSHPRSAVWIVKGRISANEIGLALKYRPSRGYAKYLRRSKSRGART